MFVPISFIDPLDHFLAPLMLEIDVDIRRFIPAFGDKAGEEQLLLDRIDRGDVEDVADERIGRAASALAKDILAARILNDGMDVRK